MTQTPARKTARQTTLELSQRLPQRCSPALPPGDPVHQIKALIDQPDTRQAVEALDAHTLFRLIKTAGFDQGVDLIPYSAPSQIQAFLDFDVWRRDQLLPKRMHRWLGALIAESSDDHFKQVMRQLDAEVLGVYFKDGLQVYLADDGRIPEDVPDEAVLSPDLQYALVYTTEDEEHAATLRALITRQYALDMSLAWTFLEAVRWELKSDMEEHAYRWRSGRLQDHGFVPREEAMSVYRPLDPTALRQRHEAGQALTKPRLQAPERLDLPRVLTSELEHDLYLLQIIHSMADDAQVRELLFELTTLLNRTLVADGIEPGELESGRQVVRRTLGYASLGLEHLSRRQDDLARQWLTQLPLRDIFRAGYTLVAKLQRQAHQLTQRPTLTMVDGHEHSLLREDDQALMEALLRQRPTFAADARSFDHFKTQDQVDAAALRLGEVAIKQLWLFGAQRQSVEQLAALIYGGSLLIEPVDVTMDMAMATAIARLMISGQPSLEPLSPSDVAALLAALKRAPWQADQAAFFNPIMVQALSAMPEASAPLLRRWIEQTLARLIDELGRLKDERDALIVRQLILLAKPRA